MSLAIFDLDNTLLAGDSDYLWGQFLVEQGVVDQRSYEAANARFYEDYRSGTLDITEFLEFALQPLAVNEPADLRRWRQDFIGSKIRPITLPAARRLLDRHRMAGDVVVIITATNRFITEPIADLYGVEHLIATAPEEREGRYTGRFVGVPCYREGKVTRLERWIEENEVDPEGCWFYSDSHNDLPLLSRVARPVAVDPDPTLESYAQDHGWPRISLRSGVSLEAYLAKIEL